MKIGLEIPDGTVAAFFEVECEPGKNPVATIWRKDALGSMSFGAFECIPVPDHGDLIGCHMGPFCPDSGCKEVREVFKNVPAADVAEIVRCKDCEHWMPDGENAMVCTGPMAYCNTDEAWYCAAAKRREANNG